MRHAPGQLHEAKQSEDAGMKQAIEAASKTLPCACPNPAMPYCTPTVPLRFHTHVPICRSLETAGLMSTLEPLIQPLPLSERTVKLLVHRNKITVKSL